MKAFFYFSLTAAVPINNVDAFNLYELSISSISFKYIPNLNRQKQRSMTYEYTRTYRYEVFNSKF